MHILHTDYANAVFPLCPSPSVRKRVNKLYIAAVRVVRLFMLINIGQVNVKKVEMPSRK